MKKGERGVIGLTGGIGSGKSTVSNYLTEKGFAVVDADRVARDVVARGSPVLAALAAAFGAGILEADGSLNRKGVAEIIFADARKREQMEEITHPEIARRIALQIEELKKTGQRETIFLDAPLLFETKANLAEAMDEIWLVDAGDEVRIERVMRRDGCSREEILARINSQMDREEKRARADVIIPNEGSAEALYGRIDALIKEL